MKQQIPRRLGLAHLRDTLEQFVSASLSREQAMVSLQIGSSRLYELRTSCLAARAAGRASTWSPGRSGGNRKGDRPPEEQAFLRRVLVPPVGVKPYSCAFAASELGRRFGHDVNRSQVRLWALEHGLKTHPPKPRPLAHVRRWQRQAVGELWQLDATPDRFLGADGPVLHLFDMIDDCSRLQVGCRLYSRECIPAYPDFFKRAFERHGLPLEIYVDRAGFFVSGSGNPTQLAKRLKFYDVSFVTANSPEAKGKIERVHLVWQDRLPAYFQGEGTGSGMTFEILNEHATALAEYRNGHEIHREIGMTPQAAWDRAVAEGRSKLRRVPRDGWWELVWAEWTRGVAGPRGRVAVGDGCVPTQCANGTKVWVCRHAGGETSVVLNAPAHGEPPVVLFTNHPALLGSCMNTPAGRWVRA
ncbi:MAG: transposase family protein [Kiritimatiellae bacterium]|nr:transposase family protein [Kiritimatiellia bacterium]